MATSAATKLKLEEILTPAVKNRTVVKEAKKEDTRFAAIEGNPFYQIMFKPDASPEEKKAALEKALIFTGTELENRAKLKEFELFKEFLSNTREEMAKEIISLTDTDTFSELQGVYGDLNNDLIKFDETMKPLTDILDALYTLRTNGATFDALKEIKNDKKRQEEIEAQKAEKKAAINAMLDDINKTSLDISILGTQKTLFGFGPLSASTREEIAAKEVKIRNLQSQLDTAGAELETLNETKIGDEGQFSAEKKQLAELLNISTDEHKERQKALVQSATQFINTAKERIGSVREHLGRMDEQVINLFDVNNNMTTVYAVLNEGIKAATEQNQKIHDTLQPTENEDPLAKVQREQKKMGIEQYITSLEDSATDTQMTYADLASQSVRIKTMKDSNAAQISKARQLHTQGIAGVADRLSVVLQAVSQAALGESSAMAKDTLSRLTDSTNTVAQKEVIRVASGIDEINQDVLKAIDDVGAYGAVVKAATDVTRQGVSELRERLAQLKQEAEDTNKNVKDAIAINADLNDEKTAEPTKAANPATSPFSGFNQ